MTNINKAFNPEVSCGGYMLVEAALYETGLAGNKAELELQMEAYVPPEFRRCVTWICIPPSFSRHGSVAWKYNPPRKNAANPPPP